MFETLGQLVTGFICGAILLGGAAWQFYIWVKCDDEDVLLTTVGIPFYLGLGLTVFVWVGAPVFAVYHWLDGTVEANLSQLFGVAVTVPILCAAFFLKSCFGALLLSSALSWTVWNLLMHGDWAFIPIFQMVFHLVASVLPDWVSTTYVVVTLVYSLFSSLRASILD